MLISEGGLESNPSFWTVVLQKQCQKLAEPQFFMKRLTGKQKKEDVEVRIHVSACRVSQGEVEKVLKYMQQFVWLQIIDSYLMFTSRTFLLQHFCKKLILFSNN